MLGFFELVEFNVQFCLFYPGSDLPFRIESSGVLKIYDKQYIIKINVLQQQNRKHLEKLMFQLQNLRILVTNFSHNDVINCVTRG